MSELHIVHVTATHGIKFPVTREKYAHNPGSLAHSEGLDRPTKCIQTAWLLVSADGVPVGVGVGGTTAYEVELAECAYAS
jgi:hypothetical protein